MGCGGSKQYASSEHKQCSGSSPPSMDNHAAEPDMHEAVTAPTTPLPPALSDKQSDQQPQPEAEPVFSPGVNKLLNGKQASQQGVPASAEDKAAADDIGELPSLQSKPRRNGSIRRATPQVKSMAGSMKRRSNDQVGDAKGSSRSSSLASTSE
mmetsp:Transcript_5981/g.17118  ORF Transcript_5981/g.17118 Transcript_5981/m.17118 type:complete len:153 (+) Transcript_5981:278-736(+)